jgi:uncharacterized protein (TIGR01777 family)
MNIGITGASGLIGRRLADLALRRGYDVTAFTRTPARGIPGCSMRPFPKDAKDAPPDFSGCDALVHLAGESVLGLWTAAKKQRIAQSRIEGTHRVVEGLSHLKNPPEVLLSGSAIGIYPDSGDSEILEDAAAGRGFLAETAVQWEEAARHSPTPRTVLLRTGLVLGRSGGAFPLMRRFFGLGLGGRLASGRQWMSWIHLDDLARMILFCVENQGLSGPVNGTAPWPVRNLEFTRALASALRRPAVFHVPGFALRLLGEFSDELLGSKRVLPGVATSHGFPFDFPELEGALKVLI